MWDEIAAAFGIGPVVEPPRPVAEAWSNEMFAVVTASGRYAVKVLAARLPDSALDIEKAVLATGAVPMAEPVGRWVQRLSTGEYVRCHRWVEGTPASQVTFGAELARDVGRSVGAIHRLRILGGDSGELPEPERDRWRTAIKLPWTYASQFRALIKPILAVWRDLESLRKSRIPLVCSHRDLDPKNAVVRADGRIALMDWDYAGPVVAAGELVEAAYSFCGPDEELLAEFVRSYVDAGGPVRRISPLDTAAQKADIGWLLRNAERCRSDVPTERELGERLTPELIADFVPGLERIDRCAELINAFLPGAARRVRPPAG
jgi:Ser/Thr protein kinase RdoA (MazF antagonist)